MARRKPYIKGVVFTEGELYEEVCIPKGFMTVERFQRWLNDNYKRTFYGYRFEINHVHPILIEGKLPAYLGGHKLEIRRCNIPGEYHGMIIKVIKKLSGTKRKVSGQKYNSKLTYINTRQMSIERLRRERNSED